MKTVKIEGVQTFAEDFVKTIFWEKTFERNPNVIRSSNKLFAQTHRVEFVELDRACFPHRHDTGSFFN